MSNYTLVDISYLKHYTKTTLPKTTDLSNYKFNVLTRLEEVLTNLFLEFPIEQVILCRDCPRDDIWRKDIYPDYKLNRNIKESKLDPMELELNKLIFSAITSQITKVAKSNRIPLLEHKRFESDDLEALIIQHNNQHTFTVVARDFDLYQLLDRNVRMFDFTEGYFTHSDFILKYRIHPKDYWIVKCLAGDVSDNIIAIKGVGEKSVLKYLLKELPQYNESGTISKKYKAIEDGYTEYIERFAKIIQLPCEENEYFGNLISKLSKFSKKPKKIICNWDKDTIKLNNTIKLRTGIKLANTKKARLECFLTIFNDEYNTTTKKEGLV